MPVTLPHSQALPLLRMAFIQVEQIQRWNLDTILQRYKLLGLESEMPPTGLCFECESPSLWYYFEGYGAFKRWLQSGEIGH